jgi:hypothetical protein
MVTNKHTHTHTLLRKSFAGTVCPKNNLGIVIQPYLDEKKKEDEIYKMIGSFTPRRKDRAARKQTTEFVPNVQSNVQMH